MPSDKSVTSITITPPSAILNLGDKLTLTATVVAGTAQTNRGVTWTSANTAVATVNAATGEVTAIGFGTTTIIATSAADTTVKAAAPVTVGSTLLGPFISAINQNGKAADPTNISGRIDVVVVIPADMPSVSTVDLLMNCGGTDTVVATEAVAAAASGERSFTLSFNTVGFKNGPCTLQARATTTTGTIVRSSGALITLNNPTTASAASLRSEHLRHARLQRVEFLS